MHWLVLQKRCDRVVVPRLELVGKPDLYLVKIVLFNNLPQHEDSLLTFDSLRKGLPLL